MKKRVLSLVIAAIMMLSILSAIANAVSEPVITSHKDGKNYAADEFYIKWKAVTGATRYRLAVKSMNDGSYAADIWWDDKLTKTKYECDEDDIKPGHRYKIWVGACGSSHDDVISQYSIEVTAKAAVCDHDDYEDYYDYSKYEQISGDNTYHNAVHYYERVCEDCDETIKTNVKGNIEKEKHNFSGDKCKACGYKKTCMHSDYEDYYDYTKYEQISNDNNYHNAVSYYERVCEDCDKTIKSDVKGDIKKEPHSFSGDKCKSCGYVKKETVCQHPNYDDYYSTTKYEQISGDNNYHNAVNYYDRECDDCGKTIKTDVKGEIKKEAHSFSGDKCKSCGYVKKETVCQHPDYDDYYSSTKYEQISGDNNYHNAVNYYDRECDDCGKTIKTDIKGEIKKESHSFSGDKCKSCGYVKKETVCQHLDYDDYYSTTKYEQISGDSNYHNAINYYDRECDDCGKTIKTGIKGDIKKESHNFSGDKCKSCNYVKKSTVCQCTYYEDYYSSTKYEQISGDDNYHNAVNYYDRKCDDCGKTLKTGIKGETKKETHSFSGNKCTKCSYNKVCSHTNSTDQYFDTKYTQINGDDTYHTATHYYNKTCNKCGKILERNRQGSSEKEKHNYSDNKCSDCGYKTNKEEQKNGNKNTIVLGVGESKGYLNDTVVSVQNNKGTAVIPYVENGRTLIPLRFVSETLGAQVDWDGSTQKITITYGNTTAYYWIGKKTFEVNGRKIEDLAAPKINNGNTFVPIRKLCEEVFGMSVKYISSSQVIVIGEANENDSYYNNKISKVHTHRYKSNNNGTHSCVKNCSGTTKSCSGNPCSVCGYSYSVKQESPSTNTNTLTYYEIEDLLSRVPIIYPFDEFEEPVYNVVYKQKNDVAESWKAFARRSWSEKMELAAQVLWGKANGNNDVYGAKMYKKILLEILAQATKNLDTMNTEETTQMLLEADEKGAKVTQELINVALKRLEGNSKLTQPIKLANSACSGIENTMKYGKYAFVLYQCFVEEYEQNAQYLLLMSEFVNATENDTLKRAMNNIIDDFVKKSEDKFYEFKKQVPNLAVDISKDILKLSGIISSKVSPLIVFDVADFAQAVLYAFTDIDEKLEASECLGFSHLISMSFSNGFYEKGKALRKDGFDDKDNEYMRSAFELCRASAYLNYKYLSEEFTDSGNQKWINEAIHAILGKSIKSYLQ